MTPEELPKLPTPELPIGRTADVNQIAQTVTGKEDIPQAPQPEDAWQSQAHAAEIAQPNGDMRDLPQPSGASRHALTSKQEPEEERRAIIGAIQECARKLGTTPSFHKMNRMTGIGMHRIQQLFGGYNAAVGACGLEPHDAGRPRTMAELFVDWAEVARKVGKAPTRAEFDRYGRNSPRPLMRLFHSWSAIPEGMRQYALEHGLEGAWSDVIGITEAAVKIRRNASRMRPIGVADPPLERLKRTSFGDPLTHLPMVHAPTCENAVLFLFGALANDLGFKVRRMQAAFPDCLAVRRVGENLWEDVKIEMELLSGNFAAHGHDPKGCDLIVCWEHNWPECPLEVVELRKEIAGIAKK